MEGTGVQRSMKLEVRESRCHVSQAEVWMTQEAVQTGRMDQRSALLALLRTNPLHVARLNRSVWTVVIISCHIRRDLMLQVMHKPCAAQ